MLNVTLRWCVFLRSFVVVALFLIRQIFFALSISSSTDGGCKRLSILSQTPNAICFPQHVNLLSVIFLYIRYIVNMIYTYCLLTSQSKSKLFTAHILRYICFVSAWPPRRLLLSLCPRQIFSVCVFLRAALFTMNCNNFLFFLAFFAFRSVTKLYIWLLLMIKKRIFCFSRNAFVLIIAPWLLLCLFVVINYGSLIIQIAFGLLLVSEEFILIRSQCVLSVGRVSQSVTVIAFGFFPRKNVNFFWNFFRRFFVWTSEFFLFNYVEQKEL